ncbi:hypothetical protein G7046_g6771 [Stylonectria norvegica]|nr:hypothetical protein G7046_g6771 [Stylonectria norvegica]
MCPSNTTELLCGIPTSQYLDEPDSTSFKVYFASKHKGNILRAVAVHGHDQHLLALGNGGAPLTAMIDRDLQGLWAACDMAGPNREGLWEFASTWLSLVMDLCEASVEFGASSLSEATFREWGQSPEQAYQWLKSQMREKKRRQRASTTPTPASAVYDPAFLACSTLTDISSDLPTSLSDMEISRKARVGRKLQIARSNIEKPLPHNLGRWLGKNEAASQWRVANAQLDEITTKLRDPDLDYATRAALELKGDEKDAELDGLEQKYRKFGGSTITKKSGALSLLIFSSQMSAAGRPRAPLSSPTFLALEIKAKEPKIICGRPTAPFYLDQTIDDDLDDIPWCSECRAATVSMIIASYQRHGRLAALAALSEPLPSNLEGALTVRLGLSSLSKQFRDVFVPRMRALARRERRLIVQNRGIVLQTRPAEADGLTTRGWELCDQLANNQVSQWLSASAADLQPHQSPTKKADAATRRPKPAVRGMASSRFATMSTAGLPTTMVKPSVTVQVQPQPQTDQAGPALGDAIVQPPQPSTKTPRIREACSTRNSQHMLFEGRLRELQLEVDVDERVLAELLKK